MSIPRLRSAMRTPNSSAVSAKSRRAWARRSQCGGRRPGCAGGALAAGQGGEAGRELAGRDDLPVSRWPAGGSGWRCPSGCRRAPAPGRRTDRSARWPAGGRRCACLGEADAEILAHPVDGEAEVELALQHGVGPVLHLPGLRGALGDHLDQLGAIEPGALGEVQPSARPCSRPAMQIWLTILASWPEPVGPISTQARA